MERTERMSKLNITLPEDVLTALKLNAQNSGMDMAEYVNTSFRLMNTVLSEKKQGRRIYSGTETKVTKELRIP